MKYAQDSYKFSSKLLELKQASSESLVLAEQQGCHVWGQICLGSDCIQCSPLAKVPEEPTNKI